MRTILKKIFNLLKSFAILTDIRKFKTFNDGRFKIKLLNLKPYINDKTILTDFDLHYIYHPAWAARILARTKPLEHTDISSTLTFSTIISAFIQTKFYDYRPANLFLENLTCTSIDLNSLPFKNNSINSLSCMHTVEHIGLGRYGDAIDPAGDLKAIKELKRVLSINGNLLFVVPIGRPKIVFNAHRIYSYEQILSYFSDLTLKEFTLISEKQKRIIINANPELAKNEKYACGCFWFTKK